MSDELDPTSTEWLRLDVLNHRFLHVGLVNGGRRAPCRPRILFLGDHESGRDAVINTIVTALTGGNYVNNVVVNPTTEVTSSLLQMFIDADEDAESDMSAFFVNTPPWPRTNTSGLVDIIVKGHLRQMDADEFNNANPADVPSAPFQKSQHFIVLCVRAADRKKQEVVSQYVNLVATAGRAGIATVVVVTFTDKEDPRVLQQPSLLLNAHDPKLTEMRNDLSRALGVPIHRVHPWVSYGVGVRFPNGDVDEYVNKHALTILRSVYADVDGYFRQLNGGVRTHPSLEVFKGDPVAVKCHFVSSNTPTRVSTTSTAADLISFEIASKRKHAQLELHCNEAGKSRFKVADVAILKHLRRRSDDGVGVAEVDLMLADQHDTDLAS